MTPKEKAQDLVKLFLPHTHVSHIPLFHSKKCALICVEKMRDVYATALHANGFDKKTAEHLANESKYLNELKTEIEKL